MQDQQKYELFQAAVAKQTEIMIENILGQGIDIHLLGLREAAKDTAPTAAHPLPALFTDESYRIANTFLLTTSQVRRHIPVSSFMSCNTCMCMFVGCYYR